MHINREKEAAPPHNLATFGNTIIPTVITNKSCVYGPAKPINVLAVGDAFFSTVSSYLHIIRECGCVRFQPQPHIGTKRCHGITTRAGTLKSHAATQ